MSLLALMPPFRSTGSRRMRSSFEYGQLVRGGIGSGPYLVVVKGYVHAQVQAVFGRPIGADCGRDALAIEASCLYGSAVRRSCLSRWRAPIRRRRTRADPSIAWSYPGIRSGRTRSSAGSRCGHGPSRPTRPTSAGVHGRTGAKAEPEVLDGLSQPDGQYPLDLRTLADFRRRQIKHEIGNIPSTTRQLTE